MKIKEVNGGRRSIKALMFEVNLLSLFSEILSKYTKGCDYFVSLSLVPLTTQVNHKINVLNRKMAHIRMCVHQRNVNINKFL